MRSAVLSLSVCLIFCLAAGAQTSNPDAVYPVGSDDLLEIRVDEEPTLNLEIRVSANGQVELPLLGDLDVSGKTPREIANEIERLLEASYLREATVRVRVKESRSRTVSVLGAVENPGPVQVTRPQSLLATITAAGGLASDHGPSILVRRRARNGLSDEIEISTHDLLVRADPSVNIPVFTDDVVAVAPQRETTILLMGEVSTRGALIFKSGEAVTLLTAIARAGGLTERASKKVLIKRRQADGRLREFRVSYKAILAGTIEDFPLQDGDIIVVRESFL